MPVDDLTVVFSEFPELDPGIVPEQVYNELSFIRSAIKQLLETGQETLEDANANTTAVGGIVPGTLITTMSATKNGTQQVTGTAYQDIIGWDAPDPDEITGSPFDIVTGEFTAPVTGKYRPHYNLTLDQYNGNNRDSAYSRMVLNGSLIKGSEQTGYHRQNAHGFNHYSFTKTISLTATDVVKLQCRNAGASRQHQVLADSCIFEVELLS